MTLGSIKSDKFLQKIKKDLAEPMKDSNETLADKGEYEAVELQEDSHKLEPTMGWFSGMVRSLVN